MAYVWMIGAMLAFASMGALAHGLRQDCGWEIIALARSVVILALTGFLVLASKVRLPVWQPPAIWFRSIAGTISMLLVFYSFTRLPVAIVVTLLNLAPVWVAILSWPVLKHAVGKGMWLAIAIGLVGVVLIQQPQLAQGNFAVLAPLAASFCIAVVMISLHRLRNLDNRAIVFHFAVVSMVGCVIAVLVSGLTATSQISFEPTVWLMLVGVGVAATTGQLLITAAFSSGPPAKLSVVALTQVGFAMLYDVVIWDHKFDRLSILGIVLVLAPTAWLVFQERRVLAGELGDG
jgi:drug/metabolite transporter (DMT)-like permease